MLACERHGSEIIWKVLRYVLYKESNVETTDNKKDVFDKIVTFYQNNEHRYSRLDENCQVIMTNYESLNLNMKDNHFTMSILEEVDIQDHLNGITVDVRFVVHFRTLVNHASKETFKQIKAGQYEYDTPLKYKGNCCTKWKNIIKNLIEAFSNILVYLFGQNVNGFRFVSTRDYSLKKAEEIKRIMDYSGNRLEEEISRQLLYHKWQVISFLFYY